MNDASVPALASLVRRTRNSLWRQRFVRSAWYAAAVSALLLLLLAVAHLALAPVPGLLWLPCALAPPALAVLWTALRRRPSGAEAAAALDRQGGHDELLVSAWELLATPAARHPAGAGLVLQRAGALSSAIRLNPRAGISPWRGRYGALPATGLLVALFLLQLPTPQEPAGNRDHHSVAGTGNGSNRQPRAAATQAPAQSVPPAADTAASAQTTGYAAVANPPARLAAAQSEDLSATEETVLAGAGLTPGSDGLPSAGAEPEAGSRGGVSDNSGAIATRPGNSADDMAAAQYQDISRNKPAGSGRKIAGAGTADLSAPRADPGEPPGAISTHSAAQRLPASYVNRFSLQQRSQITAYFARLEDTP